MNLLVPEYDNGPEYDYASLKMNKMMCYGRMNSLVTDTWGKGGKVQAVG